MDEAARIDGASALQTLFLVLLPQARPALVAIAIFHFLFAWNDFYEPLIYLHSQENWTLAVGLQTFEALYAQAGLVVHHDLEGLGGRGLYIARVNR